MLLSLLIFSSFSYIAETGKNPADKYSGEHNDQHKKITWESHGPGEKSDVDNLIILYKKD
jgi:hypothetical protein